MGGRAERTRKSSAPAKKAWVTALQPWAEQCQRLANLLAVCSNMLRFKLDSVTESSATVINLLQLCWQVQDVP